MIKTLTVESINIKAPKEGMGKNNKPYKLYPIGIKAEGVWMNGAAFSDKDVIIFQGLKNGDTIELEVYEELWQGKPQVKFKLPTKDDRTKNELTELEDRVTKLESVIKSLVKNNNLIFKSEPAIQKPIVKDEIESDLPFWP